MAKGKEKRRKKNLGMGVSVCQNQAWLMVIAK